MAKIQDIRNKIDQIDDQLLKLINRRGELAIKIGQEKSRDNCSKHFHVPHRERAIIERIIKGSKGPFPDESLESVFREIFSATLALEKPLRIGFLGPETTFSHQAAIKQFGHSSEFIAHPNIESVFRQVEQGACDYGLVPVENSIEGVINLTLDCFVDSPLLICDEIKSPIALYLLSKSKDQKKIKAIYTHPQPLGQCRQWLSRNLPGVEQIPTSSTASAAEMVVRKRTSAAVAGKLAAEVYNLNIIAKNIQDRSENYTRFLIIGKDEAKKAKRNKTSVMFSIKDEAGSLLKVLQLFGRNKINLSKIQSRPLRDRPWEYLFYVDLEGHTDDSAIQKSLASLKKMCLFLRVLGSYPRKA
ncbi:MAG: prephenate dehydratase [Nitrospinaceae bacterium]|mgnify:FL=1|nr:prephenate dehydratase [Nitrospinaceae bacterium]